MVADCVCCLSQDGLISAIRMYPLRLYKVGKTPIQNRSMNYSFFFNVQMVEEAVEAMGVYLIFLFSVFYIDIFTNSHYILFSHR